LKKHVSFTWLNKYEEISLSNYSMKYLKFDVLNLIEKARFL